MHFALNLNEMSLCNGCLINLLHAKRKGYFSLYDSFSAVPSYMLSDADVYSVEDLENVRKEELSSVVAPLVQYGKYHIEGCKVNLCITVFFVFFSFINCNKFL